MTEDFDVEFIDRGERKARFLVRNVTPAFANGIRRAMIADVPTLSIDTLRVIENSSVMFDEQIGLRLGLVPLTTPPGEFEEGDTVTLSLDVSGPGTAFSGDLISSDEMVQPADDNIPIIDLKEGQRLELEADAVLGSGKDHAKHQGGVAVGYRHLQRVEVVGDRDEFGEEEPRILRGTIEDDGELVPTETFDHDLSQRFPGKEVEVHDVPNAFVFDVESDGSFTVEELVTQAVDSLTERADELEQAIQL
ncbi:DNA-directed RNA polymerase subunit D [Haladaptatus paucihalophilus DX253]|uniref:DNA-directed RNA polymerase subunit Rpo3 n=1 Tax=Haladaptatus paucihalophilus DX253 TaxID=797209 RepID=E7QSE6_HALPU|nr:MULTISPECIES: DNA-directed RNA polymerase subunit D [Haladaptatus]EFW92915.1 DNA-directed RNA polymerase subunit D [Haladaptatus paucihalophilus DX253]ODR79124.1 DNA-directed RNA polymerase subunit D [Haladaptatus sp. W1]GKZ13489.1 DNA-directed RNA polymerase subunit D [Haladaptatus sp. T7]SHK08979.1 DNA-directed RNA polymerase, subunit D [Haladaptatus paucihalophilus DX253]